MNETFFHTSNLIFNTILPPPNSSTATNTPNLEPALLLPTATTNCVLVLALHLFSNNVHNFALVQNQLILLPVHSICGASISHSPSQHQLLPASLFLLILLHTPFSSTTLSSFTTPLSHNPPHFCNHARPESTPAPVTIATYLH